MHSRSLKTIDPRTPTILQRREGVCRVFTDQAGIACASRRVKGGRGGGRRAHLLHALQSCLAIDHASLSRRGTVRTPNRDASNISGAHVAFLPHISHKKLIDYYLIPFLCGRLWPPSIHLYPKVALRCREG